MIAVWNGKSSANLPNNHWWDSFWVAQGIDNYAHFPLPDHGVLSKARGFTWPSHRS